MTFETRIGGPRLLSDYLARQLGLFGFEESADAELEVIVREALKRFQPIARGVKMFDNDRFDHLNSLQYATFVYLAGRVTWERNHNCELVDQLFFLNKSICSIEIYPAVKLPELFFISHGIGSVLGNAEYGSNLVIFQNVTVGRVGENRPVIGSDVILYAGSAVTGRATIGDNVVVSAGTHVHNAQIPDNSMVRTRGGQLEISPIDRDFIDLYLHKPR